MTMEKEIKWTRRMREIVRLMRDEDAIIGEKRDTFLERSTYTLTSANEPGSAAALKSYYKTHQGVTPDMLHRLSPFLVERRRPVYRHGKYITSESVFYHPDSTRWTDADVDDLLMPSCELPESLRKKEQEE